MSLFKEPKINVKFHCISEHHGEEELTNIFRFLQLNCKKYWNYKNLFDMKKDVYHINGLIIKLKMSLWTFMNWYN